MTGENETGSYCSLRNGRRRGVCLVRPVIKVVTRTRIRQGRTEVVHLYLCAYHAGVVKD
jgi:hypothetical protein